MKLLPDIEDFLLAQGLARKAQLQDRHAGGVVFQNVGGEHAGRHLAQRGLHGGGDLRDRHIDLDVGMEVNLDDRVAGVGLRFDVLDVVDVRGEAALEARDDALLHLVGRQARIHPEDADDGNVDIREDIDGHGDDGSAAQDGDQDSHHDEGVGAAEG